VSEPMLTLLLLFLDDVVAAVKKQLLDGLDTILSKLSHPVTSKKDSTGLSEVLKSSFSCRYTPL